MKERYRYTDIGLIEYTLEDGILKYRGKEVPDIEVFNTPEEARMNYYVSEKNNLLDRKNKLLKKIQSIDTTINDLESDFIFPDNPELQL